MTEIFTASLRHLAFVLCDRAACSGESGDRVYDACLVFVLHVHDLDHTQEERRIREKSLRSTENWICKGDLAVVSVKLPEREGRCLPRESRAVVVHSALLYLISRSRLRFTR
jgi:hypothetical protein